METRTSRQLQKKKKKWVTHSLITLLLVFIAALSSYSFGLKTWFVQKVQTKLEVFKVEAIEVEETQASNLNGLVSKNEIAEFVHSELFGKPFFNIDLEKTREAVLKNPLIESIEIYKKLPAKIVVSYKVHEAIAWQQDIKNKSEIWLMSATGTRIATLSFLENKKIVLDLPFFETAYETSQNFLEKYESISKLSEAIGFKNGFLVHEIKQDLKESYFLVELKLGSDIRTIKIKTPGSPENLNDAILKRLSRVVEYLVKNNIAVTSIDLRMGKKVVVNTEIHS